MAPGAELQGAGTPQAAAADSRGPGTQSIDLEALSGPGEKEGSIPLFCMSSVVSDSWRPHGRQPARLLCPWDSPGKITGVGSHFLLQGIFLTQGINSTSLASPALAERAHHWSPTALGLRRSPLLRTWMQVWCQHWLPVLPSKLLLPLCPPSSTPVLQTMS